MGAPDCACETNPVIPDGENEWFITGPEIELLPEYTATVCWQWNATSGSWTCSGGLTPVSGAEFTAPYGDNMLYYYASGAVSGAGPITARRIMWDNIPPSGSIVTPVSGEYLGGDYLLEASGSDDMSGVYKYVFRLNGNTICDIDAPINLYYWDTRSEPDGMKTISLETVDTAGNTDTDDRYIYIDNYPPVVEELSPAQIIPSSNAWVYGTAVDYLCNIDRVEYKEKKNSYTIPDWQTAVIASGSGTPEVLWYVPLSGLESGDLITLTVRAWDIAGNTQNEDNYLTMTFPVQYM